MKITLASIYFKLLFIVFKTILDFAYVNFVSPVFAYSGFSLNIDIASYIESWILYLILVMLIRHTIIKPSDFLLFLFFIIIIAPMISLYGLSDQSQIFTYSVAIVFITLTSLSRGPDIVIPHIKYGTLITLILCIAFLCISLIRMLSSGAISNINFDLTQVYFYREEVGNALYEGIWGYIIPWTTKIFTIILLAFALLNKRYTIVALLLVLQIILFGITSHKSVAVYPIFALGLYIFRDSNKILLYILLSLIFLLSLCLLSFLFFDDLILSSLFIRRVFFVPALLNYNYHEFFTANGHVYWSNSVFSSFIKYPYSLPPVNMIGSVYYGLPEMAANTGFLGTSYMHFGFPGMTFISLAVGLLIKLMDTFSRGGKPVWFYLSFIAVPFFSLFNSAALLTSLLTHGLGIAIFMAWLTYTKQPLEQHKLKSS